MLKEFRKFVMRGNVVDMAVGIIMGAAFGAIISSLVSDVVMPPIGLLLGNVDFSRLRIVLQADPEVAINYGTFVNTIVSFLIVALVMFLLVRVVNRLKPEEAPAAPATKECPYCFSTIPLKATRCPDCTSQLGAT
jgi:large conductance mechanosensitive channel